MGQILVIAEKPSVALDLGKVLGATKYKEGYMVGSGYVVTYCFGHLGEFVSPEEYDEHLKVWSLDDLPIFPKEWKLSVSEDKKKQFATIKKLLNDPSFDYVVNACDAGREGELIFTFVYELAESSLPIKRLWISSMEAKAIAEGFRNLKDASEYEGLKNAALCRAKADWLVGINGTRLFTTLYRGDLLKVGRVQSPTLAMIVNRDAEIDAFVSTPFYRIGLKHDTFNAYSETFQKKEEAEEVLAKCSGGNPKVVSVKREQKKKNPPKLYDLTSLQRDANTIFGFSAKTTLDVLQILYEKKLITYPRTDSRYLTDDMRNTAETLISQVLASFIKDKPLNYEPNVSALLNSKKVSDHHAILPTSEIVTYNSNLLSDTERKLLYLICYRLLAAAASVYEYDSVSIGFNVKGLILTAAGTHPIKKGYTVFEESFNNLYPKKKEEGEEEDTEENGVLPEFKEGDEVLDCELFLKEGKTKPKSHYTESSLLHAMEMAGNKETDPEAERRGIGTPATRAEIIEKLIHDHYVKRDKKNLIATEIGKELVAILPENLTSPSLTAEWENDLTQMARSGGYPEEFMHGIESMVRELVARHNVPDEAHAEGFKRKSLGTCPKCGSEVVNGKYGAYCKGKCGIQLGYAFGKKLDDQQIYELLSGNPILMKNLKSKKGTTFKAKIQIKGVEPYTYKTKDGEEKNAFRPTYEMIFNKKNH